MGYVAVSLLMKSEDEMMTLVVNSVRNDLISHNNYFQVCIYLQYILCMECVYICDLYVNACCPLLLFCRLHDALRRVYVNRR